MSLEYCSAPLCLDLTSPEFRAAYLTMVDNCIKAVSDGRVIEQIEESYLLYGCMNGEPAADYLEFVTRRDAEDLFSIQNDEIIYYLS